MIAKIKAAFAALQKGKELVNVETWKTLQNSVNAVGGLLVALVALASNFNYSPTWLDANVVNATATAIGSIVWLFVNLYLTTATTKRIGLPSKNDDQTNGPSETSRPESVGTGHDFLNL